MHSPVKASLPIVQKPEIALEAECQRFTAEGDRRTEEGDFSGAMAAIAKAAGLAEQLARIPSHSSKYQERFCRLQEKLGDLYTVCGNTEEAVIAYRAAEQVPAGDSGTLTDLSESDRASQAYRLLFEAGQAAFLRRAWPEAEVAFFDALKIAEGVYQGEPAALWRSRLCGCLSRLGDIHFATGRFAEAQAAYERDLALTQESLSTHPENPRLQRGLSMSLGNLGEALLALGDFAGAARCFDQSQGIRLQLCATALTNPQYLRDLLIARTRQANLAIARGKTGRAKSEIEQAFGLANRLCEMEPKNPAWQKDRLTLLGVLSRLNPPRQYGPLSGNS